MSFDFRSVIDTMFNNTAAAAAVFHDHGQYSFHENMVDWREELEDEEVRVQLQRDGLLLHPVKREKFSRIYQEFVNDYGELNYERFLKASIAETPPVPVDRRPRRRYRPFGGQNPSPPPRVADCMDASSIYPRYAEQQCGGYNFATYMSEWVKQNSAETAKNRQLFLLRRSSPGMELNDRPIPSVPTLGDYVGSPKTEEEEEQSTTLCRHNSGRRKL